MNVLKTLPLREFSNGMAEIIKTACIRDRALFEILENSYDILLSQQNQEKWKLMEQIVRRTGQIKAQIVDQDPNENGGRSFCQSI